MDFDKPAISRALIEVNITSFYTMLIDPNSALVFLSVNVVP